jgi:hypothetical protein
MIWQALKNTVEEEEKEKGYLDSLQLRIIMSFLQVAHKLRRDNVRDGVI